MRALRRCHSARNCQNADNLVLGAGGRRSRAASRCFFVLLFLLLFSKRTLLVLFRRYEFECDAWRIWETLIQNASSLRLACRRLAQSYANRHACIAVLFPVSYALSMYMIKWQCAFFRVLAFFSFFLKKREPVETADMRILALLA